MSDDEAEKIAKLNDQVRTTFQGGSICMTAGVNALSEALRRRVFDQVRRFDDFKPDNDPYGERDCGIVEVDDVRVIWKFDYYDPTFSVHSDDPTDASVTGRALTIMLAEEY
jgi:predicted lipid carrier protein YhbT